MMNATFGWQNRLPRAVLTAGAQVAGLDVGQMQNDQGGAASAWQTPAGVLTPAAGAWFQADAGAAVTWRAFLLARTNLTPAATVRVMLGVTAGAANLLDATLAGPAAGYGQVLRVLATEVTARHLRIEINDPTNPDGFLNVPLAYAGPAWTPRYNFGFESEPGRVADVAEVTTRGGQEFPELRSRRRTYDVALPSVLPGEVWPVLMEMMRGAEEGGNILFVPRPEGAEVARETVYGRLTAPSGISNPQKTIALRAWRARMTERL